ncbi:hypothetical protein CRE_09376 [Caenorhabditis remanei]|uniref:Uncharacterized protein n=1 Tax=Caenorhabditis remanei TaxID=31234 RepID=E3LIH6_CAERE|nr:hypothetical protein CRE_09376 [Caenorhabditis remanei]
MSFTHDQENELIAENEQVIPLNQDTEKEPKPKMSPELQKMVDAMYASLQPHENVFAPAPLAGQPVIPTGRLARCICSPDCTKELPQPEYEVIRDSEEDKRWMVEPTPTDFYLPMIGKTKDGELVGVNIQMHVNENGTKAFGTIHSFCALRK